MFSSVLGSPQELSLCWTWISIFAFLYGTYVLWDCTFIEDTDWLPNKKQMNFGPTNILQAF